jgi:hypothetical protein
VLTLDISDPTQPTGIGDAVLDFGEGWNYSPIPGVYDQGRGIATLGSSLVFLSSEARYTPQGTYDGTTSRLRVVDMTNPSSPTIREVALPASRGTTGLHVSGKTIAFGHYTDSPVNSDRVRFYVNRLDLSDPNAPVLAEPVNVPGSLIAYDASSKRAFTANYRRVEAADLTWQECYEKFAIADWRPANPNAYGTDARGSCSGVLHSVNLVEVGASTARLFGSTELAATEQIGATALGDDRLFVNATAGYYGYAMIDCFDCRGGGYASQSRDVPLLTFSGIKSGTFASGRVAIKGGDYWSHSPLAATSDRAVLSTGWRGKLTVVQATDVTQPAIVREEEVFGSAWNVTTVGKLGVVAMGYDGVQTISLE